MFVNTFRNYTVENVVPYYEPLIEADYKLHRHLFWCNFRLQLKDYPKLKTGKMANERQFLEQEFGFDLSSYEGVNKRLLLRNCVVPELGRDILDSLIFSVGGELHQLWDRKI